MNNIEKFIEKSNIKHGNKFNYSKVVYINNKIKVEIICPIHGSFNQRPDVHVRGQGCNMCVIKKRSENNSISIDVFLKKSKNIHGDKFDYSVSSDFVGMRSKVSIKCKLCNNIFKCRAYAHLISSKCPKCFDNPIFNLDTFKEKSNKIHGNKYDYSKSVYIGFSKKINILCNRCNQIFCQNANDHINGHGCDKCNKQDGQSYKKLNTELFVKRSKIVHGDKFDYSNSKYTLCQRKLEILCKTCNTVFNQQALHHMQGSGCPNCAKNRFTSKIEIDFLDHIMIPNDRLHRQVCIKGFVVDGIENNTIYEFLGDFWHGNPNKYKMDEQNVVLKKTFGELYTETINRFNILNDNGNIVKYVWENDWKNFTKNKKLPLKINTFVK